MKLIEQDPILADIESHVDRLSVSMVLQALATVCEGKAEHVRSDWQDFGLGRFWDNLAKQIEKTAESVADSERSVGIR
jgi:uncharacterized protein (DUF2252 family)